MFSSHSHSSAVPIITFHGPGPNHQITAVNSAGQEVARFIAEGNKKYFTISRITSSTALPIGICTGSRSSWTEDTKLDVHGTELKLTWDSPLGEQAHVKMPAPMGKLKWLDDSTLTSLSKYKLVDSSKTVIARASSKERRCDVLVPGDEILLDYLLSCWIAYLLYLKSDVLASESGGGGNDSDDIKAAVKIFSALAGAGDGGGS